MAHILSVGTGNPPHSLKQDELKEFVKTFFQDHFPAIHKLLSVFDNGQIQKRHFSAPIEWYQENRTLAERNDRYVEVATQLGIETIQNCLRHPRYLNREVAPGEVDAICYISTTGLSTPSIEAKIMNQLPFHEHTKRIPIWGLGCAGGTAGLARAFEFCEAYPERSILVLCLELCSLTFQQTDKSKSNLIGTSLFADGAACVLVAGDKSPLRKASRSGLCPRILDAETTLMPNSEDVMGWDVKEGGLHVVFAKSIPQIVETWFKPVLDAFLTRHDMVSSDLRHFIAHPGGRKVLEAYQAGLELATEQLDHAKTVLEQFGNMSSPTVLFVLDRAMREESHAGERGLTVSLGPGFSAECVLLEWENVS